MHSSAASPIPRVSDPMEPQNGTPASPPVSQPAPQQGPPNTPPAQSAPPASAPGSGPGIAGSAAPPAGAGFPSGGVAAPNSNGQQLPAAPVNPFANLDPAAQQQMLQWRQQAEQFQRYQHLIPLGYRAYQQAGAPGQPQAQPGQPQAPATNVFGLPTNFDFNLLNYVTRDPQSGQLVALPGGPPDAAIRVQQYQETLQRAQRDFWQNPEQFLGKLIEERAQKVAERQYQERFQGHQQAQQADNILTQNAGWLFEQGQDGRPATQFDPASGQHKPVLTQFGRLYAQAVANLEGQGVRDPNVQHRFALAQVQNIALQAQLRQQQAPQQGQQQAQQFVNQAAVAPPGVMHPPAQTVTPTEPPQGFDIRARMKALMDGNGITEQVFQQQFHRAGAA